MRTELVATTPWRTFAASAVLSGIVLMLLIPGGADAIPRLIPLLPISILLPALWFFAAWGYGAAMQRCGIGPRGDALIACAMGTALLLTLVQICARSGLLMAAGGAGAWLLIGLGIAAGAATTLVGRSARRAHAIGMESLPPHQNAGHSPLLWLAPLAAGIGVITLLLAAHSTPGWLWRSEFGGYDVLSYHLQLPAEWLALGQARGVTHNVYSFLPSFMETAFLHLMVLRGDAHGAAIAAQMLHAGTMLLATACTARLAGALPGICSRWIPAALLLAVPWVIVTGSMAYNEGVLLLALSAGLLVITSAARQTAANLPRSSASVDPPWRTIWVPLGLLTAAACGAKPTAAFLVGLPLAAALLLLHPMRPLVLLRCAVIGGAAALVPLLPWLIHSAVITGNPIFPYGTDLFGSGHWTAQQVERWHSAHQTAPDAAHLLHRFLRQGIGPAPEGSGEPWLIQWSLLPALGVAGAAAALVRSGWRLRSADDANGVRSVHLSHVLSIMLLMQIAGWLLLTHQQARFLLPAAPLLALLACMLLPQRRNALHWLAGAALFALAFAPALLLRGEGGERPFDAIGGEAIMNGVVTQRALQESPPDDPAARTALLRACGPSCWIGFMIPRESRVLCVGWATPFHVPGGNISYHTVWDRGPWNDAVAAHGTDAAAIRRHLSAQGYTHLLVDLTMLTIWERSGWSDPATAPQRVLDVAREAMTPVIDDGRGVQLYRLDQERGAPLPRSAEPQLRKLGSRSTAPQRTKKHQLPNPPHHSALQPIRHVVR